MHIGQRIERIVVKYAILTAIFLWQIDAQALHAGHAHAQFGKIKSIPYKPRLQSQASNLNTARIDDVVEIFKRNVLRLRSNPKLDLVFVIDASYSVQLPNFKDEIRFVARFVSGIPVSFDTTRVAVITFADNAQVWVDQVTADNIHDHKCSLLGTALPAITYAEVDGLCVASASQNVLPATSLLYRSGSTYTLGGLTEAKKILDHARPDSKKVVLLITDGRSNGGDPIRVAQRLTRDGVEVFTFGVQSGNVEELNNIASNPKEDHVYVLASFAEFEAVARRALHADAEGGNYLVEDDHYCHKFCAGENCCHSLGKCRCGTTTGIYECVCDAGHFGFGLLPDGCMPCPAGTYKVHPQPGGPESCTPCPDRNMISINGSSSIDQCVCIEGYEKVDTRCDVIRCAVLAPPYNGRFQGLQCDNQYRSACRAMCDNGYDLLGTERMTCAITGHWKSSDGSQFVYPRCQVRYCPALAPPTHASLNCSNADLSYKTVCKFQCAESFAFVGASSVYCQANTEWDAETGQCQEIRCKAPHTPIGGSISQSCMVAEGATLPYGHTCTMSCPSGFALSVLSDTTCFQLNRWTVDTTTAKCIDTEAPTLQCPDNIEVEANPQLTTTEVDWVIPVPSDNSDQVTLNAIPAVTPPSSFFIGRYVILYRAVDGFGLHAECNFSITVIDTTPPNIEKCQNPLPFVVEGGETIASYATWDEPTFSDNSGTVMVNATHPFGDMLFGQTKVTYVARDPTGNTRTCVITVSVQNNNCPPLEDPKYGHKLCQVENTGVVGCELVCDSKRYGMAMHEHGSPYYECGDYGVWQPEQDIPKDCSHQRYSSEVIKSFRGRYSIVGRDLCNDTQLLESVRLKLVDLYTVEVPKWCVAATVPMRCHLVSVSVVCVNEEVVAPVTPPVDDYYNNYYDVYFTYSDEPEPASYRRRRHIKIQPKQKVKRQRRQAGSDVEPIPPDAFYPYGYGDPQPGSDPSAAEPTPPEVPRDVQAYLDLADDVVLSMNPELRNLAYFLEITVVVHGEIDLVNDDNVEESRQQHGQMSEFFGLMDASSSFSRPVDTINHMNTSEPIDIVFEQNTYAHSLSPELQCPLGAVLRESATCVNCPIGAFYDVSTMECVSCRKGFYQDEEAQLACKACPVDTSTAKIHARTLEECKALCTPGTYSSDGLETCIACARNMYSDEYGSTECVTCPPEMGTTAVGASSYKQCGILCPAGQASWTGIAPCYPCPINTYQYLIGQTFCYECPETTSTADKGSTDGSECIGSGAILDDVLALERLRPFSSCFMDPCENAATCEPSSAGYICLCLPGFDGVNCEINVDECASGPCQNGGTCSDMVNGYSCTCADGYEGDNCETETNECEPEPCYNGATCVDELAAYSCLCVSGYTGVHCETNIDDCTPMPCENAIQCVDGVDTFTCECEPGYTGIVCGIDVDECASDPCINGGTCTDRVNGFTCECPIGFTGELCQINIDDCVGQTCNNNGSCVDLVNGYRCFCAPTFAGTHCDDELEPNFDLIFNKPNVYHHVHFKEGFRNMTEITVAFYMYSNNTESEGTPFSYGVGKGRLADAFTLTNIEALTLYVNGEAVVTDVQKLNDGQWYHVVVTWKSEDGSWNIYINKVKSASGAGLQTGTVIPGGGIMVIGQEQDCLGGCFSSSQEFLGSISQFNVYDYAMTDQQVTSLFYNCVRNKGNLRAWPDALGGIVGALDISRPPSFCQPCPEIPSVNNMKVRKPESHVNYLSCEVGHNMYMRVGIGSRRMRNGLVVRCGNVGKWRYAGVDRENPSRLFYCTRKSCRPYTAPPLGSVEATGRLYGDTANFSCNEGYKIKGQEQIRCLANQRWSGTTPSCVDLNECEANPCHNMATCGNSDGSFSCTCEHGYTGDGFDCVKIDCGRPNDLANGQVLGETFFLNDVVSHRCDVGYELHGPLERTCQETGQWTGVDPSCDIIQCVETLRVENAQETHGDGTYLSEISYECHPGFKINGPSILVCLETKQWSGEPPVCDRVQCPNPPIIDNAIATPVRPAHFFEDQIQILCNIGYSISGDESLLCGTSATWEGQQPVCNPNSCGPPQDTPNGRIEGTSYIYLSTVEYICDTGYNLHGTAVIQCLAGPLWSGVPPTCDPVPCGSPPTIGNGQVSADGTVFLSVATYTCDEGYYMDGKPELACLASGLWGYKLTDTPKAPPTCPPVPCGPPSDVNHGSYMLFGAEDFVFGSHVRYSCDEGYFSVGQAIVACKSDRTWNTSADIFRCDPVPCPAPEALKNGVVTRRERIINGDYTFGQTIYFACNSGFNLVGSNESVCQATGTWSTAPPLCEPVHCGEPPIVNNAATTLNDGPHRPGPHFQSQVTYTCHDGYIFTESHTGNRICGSDAKWTGNLPSCERKSCLHPPVVDHATSSPYDDFSEMFFGDVTSYSCDTGFQLAPGHTGTLECLASGSFSTAPVCQAIPCGPPPTVAYAETAGYHPNAEHSFESEVTYNCEPDFDMSGTSTISCLKSGQWSTEPPVCNPVLCSSPDSVQHGFTMTVNSDDVRYPEVYDASTFSPRSAAITACDDGYQITETIAALTAGEEMPELERETVIPALNTRDNNNANKHSLSRTANFSPRQREKLGVALEAMFAKIDAEYEHEYGDEPEPAALTAPQPASPPDFLIRRCSPVGAWLRAAPACQPMLCPPPQTLIHGHVVVDPGVSPSGEFLSHITYQCDEGYAFSDNSVESNSTCAWQASTGTVAWTALPQCWPVPCPMPVVADNGFYTINHQQLIGAFVFMDSITYSCDSGFDLHGAPETSCDSGGNWDHHPPLCSPVQCPMNEVLENGLMHYTTITYQSTISFLCDVGYELHGVDEITCLANRQWSDSVPRCEPIPCGPSPPLEHGFADTTSEVYEGEATYSCDPGFFLNGSKVYICSEAGLWLPQAVLLGEQALPPSCHRVNCYEPLMWDFSTSHVDSFPEVDNVDLLTDDEFLALSFVFETIIHFDCEIGYETFEPQPIEAVCLADGFWSRDSPYCEPKNCGPPPPPDVNGYLEGDSPTFGNEFLYYCNLGYYTLAPYIKIYCNEHGNWSSTSIPPCLPADCGMPLDPLNGGHIGEIYTFPESVNYTCDLGYEQFGTEQAFCGPSGEWDAAPPDCIPVDCGFPAEIDNGILNITRTYFPSFASYHCLPGYELFGIDLLQCVWNGMWDALPPDCLPVDCGEPPTPVNGFSHGNSFIFQSIVHFTCDDGYILHGADNTTCLAEVTWSNPTPGCLPVDCGQPPTVLNAGALWDGVSTTFKNVVLYQCDSGYEKEANASAMINCQADGIWSTAPSCDRVQCPFPTIPDHGQIAEAVTESFVYEVVVHYVCDRGYPIQGSNTASCTADRTWSNIPPTCEPIDCGRLPDVINGLKDSNETLFMAVTTYECYPGYEAVGDVVLQCLHTGLWDKEPPVCAPISCGAPPSLTHGSTIGGGTPQTQLFESLVAYDCDDGFFLAGPTVAKCTADRNWTFGDMLGPGGLTTNHRPVCRKIYCPAPPMVVNGYHDVLNYSYGDVVTYACNSGYDLRMLSESFMCTAAKGDVQGFYTGVPPTCDPVSCGMPVTVDNGFFVTGGTTYLKTATYSCHDGHYSIGQRDIICQANRSWSAEPSCNPHDCAQPPVVANSQVNVTSTLFRTALQYKCDIGYDLKGSGSTECLASATWSDVSGWSCDPVPCGNPVSVANATHVATGEVFGDTVTYTCSSGFLIEPLTLSNAKTLACLSSGSWEDITFTCQPVSCGPAARVTNGKVILAPSEWSHSNVDLVHFPDVLEYSCNTGYYLDGNSSPSCNENASFSSPTPMCLPVLCGLPDDVANSTLTLSGVTFGHNATFTCDVGHVIRQENNELLTHYHECSADESWLPPAPPNGCEPIHCVSPTIVNHASISSSPSNIYKYRDVVTYECDAGYESLPEELSVTCLADKQWSRPPTCTPVDCGTPACPLLSDCQRTGTTFQQTATSSCIVGHEFSTDVTSFQVTCNADRQWSAPPLPAEVDTSSCRRHSCGAPRTIDHGEFQLNEHRMTFGATVTYTCDRGHEFSPGSSPSMECLADKSWGPNSTPACQPKDCGPIHCPLHGSCVSDGTIFESTWKLTCDTGHELSYDVFDTTLTCLDTGTWSSNPSEHQCLPVKCPIPGQVANGRITSGNADISLDFEAQVVYECDEGYYMVGSSLLTCTSDRTYSNPTPHCLPVSCGDPPTVANGLANFDGITFQHTANYLCLPGYDMFGDVEWFCSHDKRWTPHVKIAALPPPIIPRAAFLSLPAPKENEASGSGSGDAPSFETTPLSDLPGAFAPFALRSAVSAPSGSRFNPPVCKPTPCGTAPHLSHGTSVNGSTNFVFKQSVAFICDDGFFLQGTSVLYCLEDGTFGPSSKPSCERVSCGDPPSLTHGTFTAKSVTGGPARFVFEDVATYVCDSGYEHQAASPVTTLTCNDQRAWSPHAPSPCHPVSCGEPAFPTHTVTTGSVYTFGQTVKYSCEAGYYLVGFPVLTCTAGRQWSPRETPTCAPVSCGHPSKILHGSYTNEQSSNELDFTYQRNVTYSCQSGYHLHVNTRARESETLTCQANGQWDSMSPTCPPVSCGQPQPISNGHVNGSVFTYGNEVTYACNVGYEMTGEPVKRCQADQTWTGPPPVCSPVSCDRPPHVEHSQYTLSPALTYGNSVSYRCDAGYDMSGSSTLTCTALRVYDLPSPVCIPVSCGEPAAVVNGRITVQSGAVTFGHNVTYGCDAGYELRSGAASKTIRCTTARTWSDLPPICDPVSCGNPALIEHGNVASTTNTYLSIAAYTCEPGYELGGSGTGENCKPGQTCLICQADRLWGTGSGGHPNIPVHCSPLSCVEPTGINNGRVSVTSYLYLSTMEYICDEGYELHPTSGSHLQCQTNYEWGPQAPPTCRRIPCPHPTPIANGQFSLVGTPASVRTDSTRHYLFEDLVQYNCHPGYRFVNAGDSESVGSLMCLATGQWDQVHPTCEAVPCGVAPPREHGHLIGDVSSLFVYSQTASYACDTGYEFTGDSAEETLTCTAAGQWSSGSPPACHPVTCGSDPHVTNGMVNAAEGGTKLRRIFGSTVTYQCLHGYFMTGADTINCGSDRQWAPNVPQCHPVPCVTPPTVTHGSRLSAAPPPPALLRSAISFTASGSGSGDAAWASSSADAAAEPVPPDVAARSSSDDDSSLEPVPPDVARQRQRRSAGSYSYGDIVYYECDSGYRATQGSVDYTTCGANGEWMRPFPQCEPVPCDPLPQIANGRRIGNKFAFGQQISYECNQGYESSSRDTYVCKADGRFHVDSEINSETAAHVASLPTCARVSCGAAQGLVNGRVTSGNAEYLFGDKLRYRCHPGHNLRGEFELTCQANRAFDHSIPTCDPVSCGNPPTLPNTQLHVTSTVYRGTATYNCSSGYVNQKDTITCQADGRWSSTSLLCAKVDCGSPPALHFGYFDINGTKYGDMAVYHCRVGYIRSGNYHRNCLANGSWSDACPVCTPVDCGPPTDPINGQHIAQGNYTFGEVVLYSCNTGYVLAGESFTLCAASTNWSAPVPTCERISCGAAPLATNGAHDQLGFEQRYGDLTTYQCDFGHEYGAPLVLTCGSDGLFDNPPPACTPKNCGTPLVPPNAEPVSNITGGVLYDGQATYRCVTGHVSGTDVITIRCRGNATFSDPTDQCVPVQCPNLPDVVHGSVSRKVGRYQDEVSYTCDEGYLLFGPAKIVCLAEAVWSEPPPTCPPVQCGAAPPVSNGFVVDEQPVYTFGMVAHYNCDRGYELAHGVNGGSKTCQSDGNFSAENVACSPVECLELPPFFNGYLDYQSIKYNASGVLTCDEGYQLGTGDTSLHFMCQADRSWSVNFDTIACSRVPCRSLPNVINANVIEIKVPHDLTFNGEVTATGPVFGDAVQYKCQTGYYLEGANELNCLSNGTWSSPTPSCLPVVCGQAPQVDNANVADATHTFGMTAQYECHLGHVVASDSMSRVCQADGSFSTHPVTCVPRSCGEVPQLLHGTPSATNGVFNDVVTFQCNSGYDRLGLESITCGSDGNWSSPPPTCVPVPCGDVTHITNGQTTSTGTNFGDVATMTCDVGYHLSTGEKSIELHCQANRTWSRDLTSTTCDPVPCEFISGIENGAITVLPPLRNPGARRRTAAATEGHVSSHHYGTKLRFTCNSGYTLGGMEVIECLSNRLWSGPPAVCKPVQCLDPPALPNANLTTTSHFFGQRAEYSCVDGHSLTSGGNFRTCNADGNFSSHEVTCSPVPCTRLPQVKHGRVVSISGSSPVFGDVADTVCDQGYSLTGPGEFQCLATGEWSGIEPTCEPNVCGTAPVVNNAHTVADAAVVYAYGDTVTYKCDQGYSLVGNDVTKTCGANGEFDNLPIQCDPVTCPEIPPMEFASVQSSGSAYGDELQITCDAGYQLENGDKKITLTCLHKGDWSEDWQLIWCVGITCDQLKAFEHGTVDKRLAETVGENFVYPSTVVYNCNPGYTLEGRSKQKCNTDGSWTGDTPTCNPVDCGPPPQPANGNTIGDKTTTLDSVVSYHCNKGFTLWPPEESSRRCTEFGSWSGSDPTCEMVTCFVDFAVDHGSLTPSIFVQYGENVAIKCDDGYEIHGNATRACRDDGLFDGETPTCNRVSCGAHPPVPNAIIQPAGEVQYNDGVNITCLPEYGLINGDLQRFCQHNRTWSGKHPTCDQPGFFFDIMERSDLELLPCGPPPISGKNVKLKHNAELQDFYDPYVTLKFRCLNGYIPSTNLTITCLAGYWSGEPQCSSKCKHICLNRGTCSSRGSCNCPRGWTGSRCHRPVCILPCLNRGYCSTAYTCTCQPGWMGSRCQTPVCDQPCQNGGRCESPNRCRCPRGYQGDDCSQSSYFNFW